jgi:hypothetical protein
MLSMVAGSAVLAAWFIARFPRANPQSGRALTLALAVAAVLFVGVPHAIVAVSLSAGAFAAVLIVVLPALIYLFLVCAWIMLFVLRALPPFIR